jgi:hypothetical protein
MREPLTVHVKFVELEICLRHHGAIHRGIGDVLGEGLLACGLSQGVPLQGEIWLMVETRA